MTTLRTLLLSAACGVGVLVASCRSSYVYSPGVQLPSSPLAKEQVDVRIHGEMSPETRPDAVDQRMALSGSAQLSYGFSDVFSLGTRAWLGYREGVTRFGNSLTATLRQSLDERSSILYMPSVGVVWDGNYMGGVGFGSNVTYFYQATSSVGIYGGAGFLYGLRESDAWGAAGNGWAITGTAGLSYSFSEMFSLNLVVTPLYQVSNYDNVSHFIVAPSLGVAFTR